MGKIFVFVNQKGGVGKTTSAINIGAYVALAGKHTLLVDFDSQGNMSSGVGIQKDASTIYDLLSGKCTVDQVIQHCEVKNLDAIGASIDLAGAAVELVNQDKKEYFLKDVLAPIKNNYDFIFIDCPPSLGILTLNGLAAADRVLVPLQCEYFAMEGVTLLFQTISRVQESINPHLSMAGVFFTMYDPRTNLSHDVVKQMKAHFGESLFDTIIPRNVRLAEAPSYRKPICLYAPDCVGAKSYEKLSLEVMARG